MRIEKCYFCSNNIHPGHGMMFARNDCKVFKFCRAKCFKSFRIKRNPTRVRWTKAFRHSMGKEMTVDPVFEFEKRRNVPVRYDRGLVTNTVGAIKKVQQIRTQRQKRFWEFRMRNSKAAHEDAELKELARTAHLAREPALQQIITLKLSQKLS